ncbi:MAG TPA: amidase [Trueperaceae bacterium]|nr:amidase [Trueperaceae bacterium]
MADDNPHSRQAVESRPSTGEIVSALAERAKLNLSEAEHERLSEYVVDSWDMADRLRDVSSPGYEGVAADLPRRAAYSTREPVQAEGASPQESSRLVGRPQPIPPAALEGGLVEVSTAMEAGEYTPLDLVNAQLERIARFDQAVRSYITVDREGALAAATALSDELAQSGPRSPLHGIPFGAKDSIPAAGMVCTFNSPLMKDWRPKRDAEAIRRMRAAGAVLVGKHNLNEFGWSLPREDDLAPPPHNPWLPEEYSVGSTSGGGAAVAARLAMFALGTDGGGSVRLPAGQHSLFGVKPGHRRVPPEGVTDGRVSEVSVLARAAEDAADVLAALLIDPDGDDSRQRMREEPNAWIEHVRAAPTGLRIAVPEGYIGDVGMEPDIQRAFESTLRVITELGHEVVKLPRPTLNILHDGVRANFVVIAAEHYFDHEGPGKDRGRYGASAGFYNLPGAFLSAADYLHALRVGELVRQQVDEVLADADMILTPTSPVTRTTTARNPKTHRRGGNAAYTSPFNISGHPGVALPVGLSSEGMPIGMQLIGRTDSEFDLLRAARAISGSFSLPAFPDLEGLTSRVRG